MFTANNYLHIKPTDSVKIHHYKPGYPPEHSPGVIFWRRPAIYTWIQISPLLKETFTSKIIVPLIASTSTFFSLVTAHPD